MRNGLLAVSLLLVVCSSPRSILAQAPPQPSGHWEGSIQLPTQELKIVVDIAQRAGTWEGAITIPAQNLKGFPISGIAVSADSVSFAMKGVPGDPTFTGKVSKDGKSLSGDFSQGGGTVPFALVRTGDAVIEAAPKSTAITKEVQGTWDGALDIKGTVLRLVLTLSTGAGGLGTGTLVSVDQNGAEIPVTAVIQTGSHLKVVVQSIAASFEGEMKDGEMTGTWTQGPGNLPLQFKRRAK